MRGPMCAALAFLCLSLAGCGAAEPALAALDDTGRQIRAAAEQTVPDLAAAAGRMLSELAAAAEQAASELAAAAGQAADEWFAEETEPAEGSSAPQPTPENSPEGSVQTPQEGPAGQEGSGGQEEEQEEQEEAASDAVLLDVNNILQNPELPNGCESTAATIVLNYLGFQVDKVTMAEQYLPRQAEYWATDPDEAFMGNPAWLLAYYCNPGPIVEAVNAYLDDQGSAYRAVDISGTPAEELYEWVEQGVPVIVWTTRGCTAPTYSTNFMMADGSLPYSNSHSVVLTGYDSEGCYVADPMYEFSYASYEVFNWCYEARGSYAVVIVEQ